tara:strand:- start:1436 stop:1795 length:360 start_codon:yes stop_codon:yes gene_type:complete
MGNKTTKKPTKRKKSVGRPKKYDIDKDTLFKLAKYNLTNIEIADIYGCDESLLVKSYSEFLTKGRAELKKRLRQTQYEVAVDERNVTMLIWLGKQILGQSEKAEIKMNKPIEEIEYMEI